MTSADTLLHVLFTQAVTLGLACCAVLLLRLPVRRLLGAHAMYLSWLIVPCALAATLASSWVDVDPLPARAPAPWWSVFGVRVCGCQTTSNNASRKPSAR